MAILQRQPDNINMLNQHVGRLVLKRAPTTNFFIQDVSIPPMQLGVANFHTQLDLIPWPGDSLARGTLDVMFKVDEDLTNYMEIWNWMVKLASPDNYSQYASLTPRTVKMAGEGVFSDVMVMLSNSAQRPNMEFRFQDAFPVAISGLRFTTRDGEATPLDVEVNFRFRHFTVHDANSEE